MGTRGPAPKRSDQRRRRNKRPETVTAPTGKSGGAGGGSRRPPVRAHWHPLAKTWYRALAESGQSAFYEPSDWATALVLGEALSKHLQADEPLQASLLATFLKGSSMLLATEADRRRLVVELQRAQIDAGQEPAKVTDLASWRASLPST